MAEGRHPGREPPAAGPSLLLGPTAERSAMIHTVCRWNDDHTDIIEFTQTINCQTPFLSVITYEVRKGLKSLCRHKYGYNTMTTAVELACTHTCTYTHSSNSKGTGCQDTEHI